MMAPTHQQRSVWAAGLVVSTTCLEQDEKTQVKHDVVAAGGRYSPNLSKRTTHLVAPVNVSSVSQKLLAATQQNRYPGLHVVSSDWLQASISSLQKAEEADYQLNIPQVSSANGPLVTPAPNSTSSRQPGSVSATPAAAAAPQTPWVVHFSQIGDSIYGVPELGSPNGHEQFVQQLQPIAELPTPPPGPTGRISPEVAAVLAASNTKLNGQHVAVMEPQASIKQQSVQSNGVTEAAAAPASPVNAHRPAPLQLASERSSPRAEPAASHTAAVTAGVQLPDTLRELLAAPNTGATRVSWEQRISPNCHHRPPPLRLDSNSSSRLESAQPTAIGVGGRASTASGSTPATVGSNSRQQQDEPQHPSALKEVAGLVNTSGSSSVEQLLQALRPLNNSFRTAKTHIAQDSLLPAAAAAVRSTNTIDELMGAVQGAGASADRWKVAAEAPVHRTVAEPGPRQTTHPSLAAQRQQQRQQSQHSPTEPSSRDTSSVADLITALRRVTGDVAGTAAAATVRSPDTAAAGTAASEENAPQRGGERRPSLDDSRSKIASLLGAWQQVKEQAQQIAQAPNAPNSAGGNATGSLDEVGVHTQPMHVIGDSPKSAALASFSNVPELVAALRGATGDSRRATAEVAVAEAAAVPLPQSQQQAATPAALTAKVPAAVDKPQLGGNPSTALGSFNSIDELIQALGRAADSSIRTTRESATNDELIADSQPASAAVPTAADGAVGNNGGQGRFGSIANVDELILALRRATASRRSTAESAVDPTGLLQPKQLDQEVGDTGSNNVETLDDLLKAISRATSNSSRRNTSDLIAGDQQDDAQQGQQQQLVDADQPLLGEISTGPADRGLMGSFSDVDTLLQALRRATGSRRSTAEVPADADGEQQQQQGPVSVSGNSLEELLGALRRPTADSRRGTADAVPVAVMPRAAIATAAGVQQQDPQPVSSSDSMLKLTRALQTSTAGGTAIPDERPAAAAGVSSQVTVVASQQQQQQQIEQSSRSDGVDHLIESLRRRSVSATAAGGVNVLPSASDRSHTPQSAAAAGARHQQWTASSPREVGEAHHSRTGTAEATAAAADAESTIMARDAVLQREQHQHQHPPSSPRNLHELVGALRRVTDNRGAGATETAGTSARSSAADAALQQGQTTPSSPRNLHELVGALRKVAGRSGKGPAEAAAATPLANSTSLLDAANLQQQQHTPASPRTVQELVGALRKVTGTSNKGIAASAGAVRGDAASKQQQQVQGSPRTLRDIVGTLRVVTTDLTDTPSAAQSVQRSTTAADAALQQQQQQQQRLLGSPGNANETSGTLLLKRSSSRAGTLAASASTAAAAETALHQQQLAPKSPMSVHELVGALRRVTGEYSRQLSEAVMTPLAAGQQQQLAIKPNTADGLLVDHDTASVTRSHKTPRVRIPARQLSAAQSPVAEDRCAAQIGTESGASLQQLVRALSRKTGVGRRSTADLQAGDTAAAAAAAVTSPVKELPSAADSDQQQRTDSPADIGQLLSTLRRVTGDKGHAAGVVLKAEAAGITALTAREIQGVQDDNSSGYSSTGAAYRFPTSTQEGRAPAAELAMHDGAQLLGNDQQGFWASITAVLDPALPPDVQQQLQQVLAGAGATVVPGHPHLGCGADTVVTEPDRAGLWLPLLMDLVSPGWVFKAWEKQKAQQFVRLTPDIARAVGLWLQQHAGMRPARDSAASSFASIRDNALVASDSRGELVVLPEIGGCATAERQLMPRQLLVDLTWSIDQDPRSVEDGDSAAVLFQSGPNTISLLLRQDSGGLLGHAITKCTASEASQGITCADVLSTVYSFYQQEVLLQEDRPAGDGSCAHRRGASQQQYEGRVVRRVVLMGCRLMFEGLVRATQDPHSTLYEVCVA